MYVGNFNVNNGTRLIDSLKSKNLKSLANRLKAIANSEIFQYNRGIISIYDNEGHHVLRLDAVWCRNEKCRWFNFERNY